MSIKLEPRNDIKLIYTYTIQFAASISFRKQLSNFVGVGNIKLLIVIIFTQLSLQK